MFNKALRELYLLREIYKDDKETLDSIDYVIFELGSGMSAILDILTNKDDKTDIYKNKNNLI